MLFNIDVLDLFATKLESIYAVKYYLKSIFIYIYIFQSVVLCPAELRMNAAGAKLNPQICPSNPELVAYICNNDIWVTCTLSGSTQRLTHVHKGEKSIVNDPFSAGIPSYVMQEEFNRFQGFWWQPNSSGRPRI